MVKVERTVARVEAVQAVVVVMVESISGKHATMVNRVGPEKADRKAQMVNQVSAVVTELLVDMVR